MEFYGRKKELMSLNESYQKNRFAFYVVYGRRRIGKTTLLRKFVEGKPALFFSAQESNESLNLKKFSQELFSLTNLSNMPAFTSWEDAFSYLTNYVERNRLILVIDEFPYIAGFNRSILSMLQHHIDHQWKDTSLFLILCGSSMSFMQNEVLGYKSPLFGRRTAQIHLRPMSFYESSERLSFCSLEDKVNYYAILGGIPQYLEKVDSGLSLKNNIKELFLNSSAYLYEEPQMLLKQELREPAVYNSIVLAIASGKKKMNEIADFTKEPSSKVSKYVANLIELEIVKKEVPFKEIVETSKKGVYRLQDSMFQFWFRFLFENRDLIEKGEADVLYDEMIEPHLTEFVSFAFEDICMEFLYQKSKKGELPFTITKAGKWWGTDQIEKKQVEIDIVCENKTTLLLGECKWQNALSSMDVLNKLKKRSRLFSEYETFYFTLFSKNGFTPEVIKEAEKDHHVLLFDLKDIVSVNNE